MTPRLLLDERVAVVVPPARVEVLLSRGACATRRHGRPTDHAGLHRVLDAISSEEIRVELVGCVGRCEREDSIVVTGRLTGVDQSETWFGGIRYRAQAVALAEWIASGGTELSEELRGLSIPPPARPTTPGGCKDTDGGAEPEAVDNATRSRS